jgi:hypothetical protein
MQTLKRGGTSQAELLALREVSAASGGASLGREMRAGRAGPPARRGRVSRSATTSTKKINSTMISTIEQRG